MTSTALIPIDNQKNYFLQPSKLSSNCYSIYDHGHGYRTCSYEFDLYGYEPEQITVLIDEYGRLCVRAYRSPCQQFRRDYYLGGSNIEARLIRNTIDINGRLRVDVDVRPRRLDIPTNNPDASANNNLNNNTVTLTFDLRGYPSKNITVRITEKGLLKIHAQHTDDKTEHLVKKEYYRQYQLPKNITADQIRAKLDEHQILTIQVPQSVIRANQSWEPYNDNNYSLAYGKRPDGNPCCCCNVM